MMSTTHHLTDETLQDYAAGSLDRAMETLVACHLTVCSGCRHRAALADAIGGSLLAGKEPVAVGRTAREVLARAAQDAKGERAPQRPPRSVGGVPRPLARLLPGTLESLPWRRIAPGVRQFDLARDERRDGAFKLLHLAPGTALSAHGHRDRELTYIVRGSYHDEFGRFRVGDIADLDEAVNHCPIVDEGEPCIALIATESPVRYNGILGRIMQPFVGI